MIADMSFLSSFVYDTATSTSVRTRRTQKIRK